MSHHDRSWKHKRPSHQREAEGGGQVDDAENILNSPLPNFGLFGTSLPKVCYGAHLIRCVGDLADIP
jgi:hypothetical protein